MAQVISKAENSTTSSASNVKTASKLNSKEKLARKRSISRKNSSTEKVKLNTMHPSREGELSLENYKPIRVEGAKFKSIDIAQLNKASIPEKQAIEEMSLQKWREYLSENESIVADSLLGQYLSKLECTACQTSSYNFEPFSIIELGIPPEADELSLIDLLSYSCKPDLLENFLWDCPKCKKDRQVTKTNYIYKLPPVLVICFKRFELVEGKLRKNKCLITAMLHGENLGSFEQGGDKSQSKVYLPYMIIVGHYHLAPPRRTGRRPL